MAEQTMITVPVTQIKVDKAFNTRKKYERIEELAGQIEAQGQLVPVIVEPTDDKRFPYKLVAGFRRYLAVEHLKRKDILAVVRPSKSEKDSFLGNVLENLSRDDLSAYEVACMLLRMKEEYKMTAKEVQSYLATSKGFSKSNINNLTAAASKLPKRILEAWAAEHPACTIPNINKWTALAASGDTDGALAAFDEAVAAKEDSGGSEGGEGGESEGEAKKAQKRVSRATIESALEAAKAANKEGVKGAAHIVETLRFVLGKVGKIKVDDVVFFDPKAVEADPEEDDVE